MNQKITVLHLIETLGLGGAEKSLVQAINGMPDYNHIVVILHEPDTLKVELRDVEIINLTSYSFFQRLKAVNRVKKIIQKKKIDLVHAQLFNSTLIGRLASRRKTPFVFTLQSMLGEDLFKKNPFARFLERTTYSRSDYLIAVSNEALNDYKKYVTPNCNRVKVIYNSIERNFFAEDYKTFMPGKRVRLVSIGNLKPLKNYDYILDALKATPKELFELDIYGDGPLKELLQKRIETEKLPVMLKGNVSDLYKRMKGYDIYLHCSKYEGSSLAIFEAMASGLPLIVSDIPVLHENTGGFANFVDLSDPMDLAKKLISMQKGQLNINSMGKKGFEWVKTIAHPDIVLKQIADFYDYIKKESFTERH